jgi:Transcription factor WhiB
VLAAHAGRRGKVSMTTATTKLNTALITMASRGDRPRCSDPIDHAKWTSEDQHDRDTAAAWCNGCNVMLLCGAAATERDERWGVWGGIDRSIRPGRKKSEAA